METDALFDVEPLRVEYLAHYWRYFREYVEAEATAEDAASILIGGREQGAIADCCVIYPDGTRRKVDYNDQIDPTVLPPHDEPLPTVERY